MTEDECLNKMIAPGQHRPGKFLNGVIQIIVTSSCNLSCFGCTQASNISSRPWFMTPDQFEAACISLRDYFGVVGVFGGCPTISKYFDDYCRILQKHIPFNRRGLWCNNLMGKGKICRETFNPSVSNLNVHLDRDAYNEFRETWPEAIVFGLDKDSRHSPPYVALKDVIPDESKRWELISNCDINIHWSAMIGVFRGELKAWFCELAGAQAILHQHEPDYPDTGLDPTTTYMAEGYQWWQLPMQSFGHQVMKHCHDCGVPLRGYGELAQAETGMEQVSLTHVNVYRPKRQGRGVELVTTTEQLKQGRIEKVTDYLGNARR